MKCGGPLYRSKPLTRTTPLRNTSSPAPGGPLKRSAPLRASGKAPAARPKAQTAAERAAKKLLKRRSGGQCELCLTTASNAAHRVAEGQGGPWAVENLVHLCGHGNLDGCHGWTHQHPDAAKAGGWILHPTSPPAVTPVWLTGPGWVLLDEAGDYTVLDEQPPPPGMFPWGSSATPPHASGMPGAATC